MGPQDVSLHFMYQYNDRLTQLFIKYKYIWLWLQCFDPYLGHRQAYIMNLESIEPVYMYYTLRNADIQGLSKRFEQ
jgi:hypothetical protein